MKITVMMEDDQGNWSRFTVSTDQTWDADGFLARTDLVKDVLTGELVVD
jgi:hypothetical protein